MSFYLNIVAPFVPVHRIWLFHSKARLRYGLEIQLSIGENMRFGLILFALGLSLAGCSATATPNFYGGHYYMAGDPNCVTMRGVSRTRIACANKAGQLTGHRDAMTPQQIQMYQFQVMQQQTEMAQMQQSIDYNNAMMAANTQATLNRAAVYSPPVVQPTQTSGGNVRCIGVGIYANCRW